MRGWIQGRRMVWLCDIKQLPNDNYLLNRNGTQYSAYLRQHRRPAKIVAVKQTPYKTYPCSRRISCSGLSQGRNHGWKVEGDQGLGPNIGALAPRTRPEAGLGVGAGGGRPLPLWGSGGVTPGKVLKTQMLNPAFRWLLRSLVGSRGRVYPSKHVKG